MCQRTTANDDESLSNKNLDNESLLFANRRHTVTEYYANSYQTNENDYY